MPIVSDRYRGKREYLLTVSELIRAAQNRGTVTYQELAHILGWPLTGNLMGSRIGHLLGEISEDESGEGRPMLSAVAVSKRLIPSDGFFELARLLGKLKAGDRELERTFWEKEKEACYETWKRIL